MTAPASLLMTRVGGRDYPLVSVSNCKTCQSPYRAWIEQYIVQGMTYAAIAKMLTDTQEYGGALGHPDKDRIAHHVQQGHFALPLVAQRALIEKRAKEMGKNLEDAAEQLVDYVTANELIIQRGVEALQAGELEVDATALLGAIKAQHSIEQTIGASVDNETWVTATMAMIEDFRSVLAPGQWDQFTTRLDNNPVIKAIAMRSQEATVIEHEA